MISAIHSVLHSFSGPFIILWMIVFSAFGGFGLMIFFQILLLRMRGMKPPTFINLTHEKQNIFFDLLWRLPARIALDRLNRPPYFFRPQGCVIFTGRQGNGKTVAMTQAIYTLQCLYPAARAITNYGYAFQDDVLDDWKKLTGYNNGIYGVLVGMDEMQNWFSTNASKNFPPEMLAIITQNRKNRRVIFGTAQSFSRLAKPIREQATEVRQCWTFFGALTIVHKVEPELDNMGDVKRWLHRGWYWFIHDDIIRSSYDTWKIVESLSESGFKDPTPEGQTVVFRVSPGNSRRK